MLVINCFLFCFAWFFNMDCMQAEGEGNGDVFIFLTCWQRLVEILLAAFKHLHLELLFICLSVLPKVDVWGSPPLVAFTLEVLQHCLFA